MAQTPLRVPDVDIVNVAPAHAGNKVVVAFLSLRNELIGPSRVILGETANIRNQHDYYFTRGLKFMLFASYSRRAWFCEVLTNENTQHEFEVKVTGRYVPSRRARSRHKQLAY